MAMDIFACAPLRRVSAAALVALALVASASVRAEVVVLKTSKLCKFTIASVTVTDATIIGTRDSVLVFLRSRQVYVHSCEWLLAPVEGMTEVQYVMEKGAKPYSEPGFSDLATNRVLVRVSKAEEFLAVFAASAALPPVEPPAGPPPSNGSSQARVLPPTPAQASDGCEAGTVCLRADGHAEFELACGPLDVQVSTDGAFGVGVKVGPAKLSIEAGP